MLKELEELLAGRIIAIAKEPRHFKDCNCTIHQILEVIQRPSEIGYNESGVKVDQKPTKLEGRGRKPPTSTKGEVMSGTEKVLIPLDFAESLLKLLKAFNSYQSSGKYRNDLVGLEEYIKDQYLNFQLKGGK